MFELMENHSEEAVIKVIGVGGGGGSNAVEYMVASNIEGVEFVAANTDAQALRNSSANVTLQLGASVTKGLGAGANPEFGPAFSRRRSRNHQENPARCGYDLYRSGYGWWHW
ncbi:cell division protein FtsZ [Alishewanella longhuensis]